MTIQAFIRPSHLDPKAEELEEDVESENGETGPPEPDNKELPA